MQYSQLSYTINFFHHLFMKIRPIINQSKFPNTNKDPTFYIRSKKSQSKTKPHLIPFKSTKTIKTSTQNKFQIQDCLQQLKSSVEGQKIISHNLYTKLERILRELVLKKLQEKDQNQEQKQKQEQFDDFQPCSLNKTFSKTSLKNNIEMIRSKQNIIESLQISTPTSPYDFKMKKHARIKTREVEQEKRQFEDKIKTLEDKNGQLQQKLKENETQIQNLKTKIQQLQIQRKGFQLKMRERLIKQNKREREYLKRINEFQQQMEEMKKFKEMMEEQLKQRQTQLLLLWQINLQNKLNS